MDIQYRFAMHQRVERSYLQLWGEMRREEDREELLDLMKRSGVFLPCPNEGCPAPRTKYSEKCDIPECTPDHPGPIYD